MKIVTITYEFDSVTDSTQPYWAKSGNIYRCGRSWKEAREKLINTLKLREEAKPTVPVPEEVEI